jgi:periplasmic protein TonB
MPVSAIYYHSPELPWTLSEDEELRYRKILKRALLLFLLLSIVMPFLPVPQMSRERVEELPPRLAQLLLERQKTPPPVPVVKTPQPVDKKPEPVKKAQPKKPERTVEAARAKAQRSGLLAFKEDLADLRANPTTTKLEKAQLAKGPATGSAPGRASERALITSSATGGSGGINTAKLSRDTGGGGLGGRTTTRVTSSVGEGGGGVRRGASGIAGRSLEEIKLVFDRNKGAIYTIYNRMLRNDPALQGKVVLKLTIAPSGQVLDCKIVSSELRSPELERKLVARIKQFDFGVKKVDTMVVTYPIDFLPS